MHRLLTFRKTAENKVKMLYQLAPEQGPTNIPV
jgi:hypothetical protein